MGFLIGAWARRRACLALPFAWANQPSHTARGPPNQPKQAWERRPAAAAPPRRPIATSPRNPKGEHHGKQQDSTPRPPQQRPPPPWRSTPTATRQVRCGRTEPARGSCRAVAVASALPRLGWGWATSVINLGFRMPAAAAAVVPGALPIEMHRRTRSRRRSTTSKSIRD